MGAINANFEELVTGHTHKSRGRTITETDVVNFAGITGNWLPIHTDAQYAAKTRAGERVVQGTLIMSIAMGLLDFNPEAIAAFYGIENHKFVYSVKIGDTIHVESEIIGGNEHNAHLGLVILRVRIIKNSNVLVQEGDWKIMVNRNGK